MVAAPLLLGLDIGTTRIKARLIDHQGDDAGAAAAATPWKPDAELTVDRLHTALRSLLADLGEARRQVVSVGIAGLAESGAPLDGAGRAVGPVIAWHDPRGVEVVDRLVAEFGDQLPRWIGQPVRTVSSVAKLGWLVGQGTGAVGWLGVPELCLQRLTGSRVSEYSLASRTGCYHVVERRYLPEVAEAAGIRPGVFPPIEPAGSVMGRISAGGAAWSGLPAGIPVTIAGHDHVVGMMGCGAGRRDLANSVGTAESVVAGYQQRPDIERALALRVAVTVMPGGDGWALLAGAARAGMILTTLAERLGCAPKELDRLAHPPPPAEGDALLARPDGPAHPPGPTESDSLLAAVEPGDPLPSMAPGARWNATLQALSLRTWEAVGRITELTGPSRRLVVFGGGSQSRRWLEEKARVGWLPVWRSTANEAVARGAALHAGVAAGWWASTGDGPQAPLEMMRR